MMFHFLTRLSGVDELPLPPPSNPDRIHWSNPLKTNSVIKKQTDLILYGTSMRHLQNDIYIKAKFESPYEKTV